MHIVTLASNELRPHLSCRCGFEMRLVGIEPDTMTSADLLTYECDNCNCTEVMLSPTLH